MKVAVIGAGIVGITTAYELAQDGHEVSVFEQNGAAAEGASFAPNGLVCPSMMLPISSGSNNAYAFKRGLLGFSGLTLNAGITLNDLRWLAQWGRKIPAQLLLEQLRFHHQLIAYSQSRMYQIVDQAKVEPERSEGLLVVVPTEKERRALSPLLVRLKDIGVGFQEISSEQSRLIEPGLGSSAAVHSGLHFPGDANANCRQFAMLLKNSAVALGVKFSFNTTVVSIEPGTLPSISIEGRSAPEAFDNVVVCTGSLSNRWSSGLKGNVRVTQIHGYSISASIREPLNAPRSALLAMGSNVAISRQGQRIRVSGGSEIGSKAATQSRKLVQLLFKTLLDYFPGSVHLSSGTQVWKGASSMTSDGLPVVGASTAPGVWLNACQGNNGWATACGSARVIADLLVGKTAEVDIQRLRPDRILI
jgi:D-amino-acid dehydrogenase